MITVRISYSSFLPYFRRAFYPGTHTFRRGDELDFHSLSLFLLLLVFTSHPWQNPSSEALLAPSLYVERETR